MAFCWSASYLVGISKIYLKGGGGGGVHFHAPIGALAFFHSDSTSTLAFHGYLAYIFMTFLERLHF